MSKVFVLVIVDGTSATVVLEGLKFT